MTPALSLLYFVVGSFLLWFVFGSRGYFALKATTIVALTAISIWLSGAANDFLGWPLPNPTGDSQYRLQWTIVDEPHSIYLWVSDIDRMAKNDGASLYKPQPGSPRALSIPYTKEMHEQTKQLQERIVKGERIYVGFGKEGQGKGQPGNSDSEAEARSGHSGESWQGHSESFYYELPAPKYGEKK